MDERLADDVVGEDRACSCRCPVQVPIVMPSQSKNEQPHRVQERQPSEERRTPASRERCRGTGPRRTDGGRPPVDAATAAGSAPHRAVALAGPPPRLAHPPAFSLDEGLTVCPRSPCSASSTDVFPARICCMLRVLHLGRRRRRELQVRHQRVVVEDRGPGVVDLRGRARRASARGSSTASGAMSPAAKNSRAAFSFDIQSRKAAPAATWSLLAAMCHE